MKFKLVETLNESLEPLLNGGAYITDSPYQIRDMLMNKPKAYRIIYDSNIDEYMICDANEYIHFDMIQDAFKKGHYIRAEKDNKIDKIVRGYMSDGNKWGGIYSYIDLGQDGYYYDENDEEVDLGQYLLYMIFVPANMDEWDVSNSPSSDGYDDDIEYSFGTIWTRDADDFSLNNCDLLRILNRYKV